MSFHTQRTGRWYREPDGFLAREASQQPNGNFTAFIGGTRGWFGGRNDQFAIEEDGLGGFNGQHSVRVLGNGNLLLFDNGLRHDPSETRAVEYRLDTTAMTATLLQLRSLYGYERP